MCFGVGPGAEELPTAQFVISGRVRSEALSFRDFEEKNIRRTLLPNLLPNWMGKLGMKTDGERSKMREVPIKWDFL